MMLCSEIERKNALMEAMLIEHKIPYIKMSDLAAQGPKEANPELLDHIEVICLKVPFFWKVVLFYFNNHQLCYIGIYSIPELGKQVFRRGSGC